MVAIGQCQGNSVGENRVPAQILQILTGPSAMWVRALSWSRWAEAHFGRFSRAVSEADWVNVTCCNATAPYGSS